ncbi:NHL repeat-containing protein [Streptomyces syringium]|uniref:NHL repeat-containing protein n=1 Tax=Streptomyces syringium TaxID=76729 RepID=UPI00341D9CF1
MRANLPDGTIRTVVGDGNTHYDPSITQGTSAHLDFGWGGVATDADGNLYVADHGHHVVYKITPDNTMTVVAGTGVPGWAGDGGQGRSAKLHDPFGVAVDGRGNVYISDKGNHRIRKVTAATGIITTVAGNRRQGEYAGDGSPATATPLKEPNGVAVDSAGNLYIAGNVRHRVYKVTPDNVITTVVGTGKPGFRGDGGQASTAQLNTPRYVTVDAAGNLYVADELNHRIRKVDATTGIITTVAGNGRQGGYAGDGSQATATPLDFPNGMAVDGAGNLFFAGNEQDRVYKVTPDNIITTVAGTGERGYGGDGGQATDQGVKFTRPRGVALDRWGNLYIADTDNDRVRQVIGVAGGTGGGDEITLEIQQEQPTPAVAPGGTVKFNVRFTSPAGKPVDPGEITQAFTAPSGFVFSRQPSYAYYSTKPRVQGNLGSPDGYPRRTLVFTANPRVTKATGPLVCTFVLQALPEAEPGPRKDGRACVGRHPAVQLEAEVTGTVAPLQLTQVAEERAQAAPGGEGKLNVEIRSTQRLDGTTQLVQRFKAPTGFVFAGGATYGYYYIASHPNGTLRTELADNDTTLLVTSPLRLNTDPAKDRSPVQYTLTIRAKNDAPRGKQRGDVTIGSATIPLYATVL